MAANAKVMDNSNSNVSIGRVSPTQVYMVKFKNFEELCTYSPKR